MERLKGLLRRQMIGGTSEKWPDVASSAQGQISAPRPYSWTGKELIPNMVEALDRSTARRKPQQHARARRSGRSFDETKTGAAPDKSGRDELQDRLTALELEFASLKNRQLEYDGIASLIHLLSAGKLDEARQLVCLLLQASPTSPSHLERWKMVLAHPKGQPTADATGGEIALNNAWLNEHAHKHTGKWVALRKGVLVGEDTNRVELHRRLQKDGQLNELFFAKL